VCFSPTADLVAGVVVTAIGVDAVRHVRARDQLAIATLPVLLGVHQLDETFVWWGLQGHVPAQVGRVAMWLYLLIALVVLPTYLPLAVRSLEPRGRRRSTMTGFAALGAAVSLTLLAAMIRGPVTARLGDHHLGYGINLRADLAITGAYVVATCGALLFSGNRAVAAFGLVNLVAVAVLARLTIDGFASLWCAWAAVTSTAIALHIRRDRSLSPAPA
jgi:uncharacterized protein DUF6629